MRKTTLLSLFLATGLAGGAAAETLNVGVIAPLTGPGAAWGLAAQKGAEYRAAEVNAAGGLKVGDKTYTVEIVAQDNEYKAANSIAVYNRLIQERDIKYVLFVDSASTLALKDQMKEDQVLAMSGSVSDKLIDADNEFMFRMLRPPSDYMPPFVDWIAANVESKAVAIVNPNDETGWAQAHVSEAVYKDKGFTIAGIELYERSQNDFAPVLTKVIATQPGIIDLGSSSPATAGLIIRQARELGYKGRFVKSGGPGPNEIVKAAGEHAEGVINALYSDPRNAGYLKLAELYKKEFGQMPNEAIAPYYDATNVLLQAIAAAGTVDDAAAVAASMGKVMPAASIQGGTITLGGESDQELMATFYVGVIEKGEPVVVAPLD